MAFPAVVGAVLSALRKASKNEITQSDMAGAIGATVSTWSRIETGETALTIEQLAQAAIQLGVRPSEILSAAEEKTAELQEKGVSIEPKRVQIDTVIASGAVPLIGGTLIGLMGPVGIVAGATAAAFFMTKKIEK